jgi:hypothetical protein
MARARAGDRLVAGGSRLATFALSSNTGAAVLNRFPQFKTTTAWASIIRHNATNRDRLRR